MTFRFPAALGLALCVALPAGAQQTTDSSTGDQVNDQTTATIQADPPSAGDSGSASGDTSSATGTADQNATGDTSATASGSDSATPSTGSQAATTEPAAGTSTAPASPGADTPMVSGLVRATSLLDGNVYVSQDADGNATDWTVGEPLLDVPAEWKDVGEIEDLALNPNGQLEGLVVEVGGFLGIGRTVVLVPAQEVRSVRVGNALYFLTRMSEDQLKALPKVDDTMWED
ncbi:PRC-barrel domain-containing protein [Oceaniglobus roseus]|uniref:PRC-barrel domain-containing protein n=1 Tax=Oceaniglobus roseus TaxID=1737570 RepID=UPI000C7F6D47|nr:PRC-barrel domain-containing protein [Kandeliimicrobium roseum]